MRPRIVKSPSNWHTHEVDPLTWYKAIKQELEDIEKHPHPFPQNITFFPATNPYCLQ